jgi:para-aminobenzoate synthetase component I
MIGAAAHRYTICERQPARVDCWSVARSMAQERFLFLLDSAAASGGLGRYSILAWRPRWEFFAKDGVAWAGAPGATEPLVGGVLDALQETLEAFARAEVSREAGGCGADGAPPVFEGGAIGFVAYELLHEIESVRRSAARDLGVADCHLLFCDLVLVTDELTARSWIVANGWGASEAESRADCRALVEHARAGTSRPAATAAAEPSARVWVGGRLGPEELEREGVVAVTERSRYLDLVRGARERICAGDVFELCLAQRFDAEFGGSGVELYDALRRANPAPMAAYLRYPELEVLSSSPERFLAVDARGWVETRPIKGTRPRGRNASEDAQLAADLATARKDGAENAMIVDVARNDLGRVCEYGTITVPSMRALERHPSVFQLVSVVRGRLRAGTTPVDLLRAAFPGASMTGAPKIEAMGLIGRMEDSRRGIFGGAIGYVDYAGRLDLSIAIRTIVKRGEALGFHAGGAITSDSEPEAEYRETLDKACALVRALAAARAGAVVGAPA